MWIFPKVSLLMLIFEEVLIYLLSYFQIRIYPTN
ncbi:hypothetical membrane protein [Bacteroides ovatus V975]|nr:hypothetical membrane protein [Bacteroides ovatus V975]